jgi:ferredoxin-2, mitochondrial
MYPTRFDWQVSATFGIFRLTCITACGPGCRLRDIRCLPARTQQPPDSFGLEGRITSRWQASRGTFFLSSLAYWLLAYLPFNIHQRNDFVKIRQHSVPVRPSARANCCARTFTAPSMIASCWTSKLNKASKALSGCAMSCHRRATLSTTSRSQSSALEYLQAVKGYNESVSKSILKAFPSTPTVPELTQLSNSGGLKAIADAVIREATLQAETSLRADVEVNITIPQDGNKRLTLIVKEGQSLLDVLDDYPELGSQLECTCAGIAACSTCHVIVSPDWFDKLPAAEEHEQDMIDLAAENTATSRLGCQLKFAREHSGIEIALPLEWNDLH